MGYNAFEILGLPSTATKEEVDQRYNELRSKYVNDRYKEGDEGEEAAEKLQQLEMAYRDICQQFADGSNSSDTAVTYEYIQQCTKENRLDEAQSLLDKVSNRDAEWHYQQSIVFYKRNWFLESKKQLEYAVQMEPHNKRYTDSMEKLTKLLASDKVNPDQLRTTERPMDQGMPAGAGNGTCTGNACMDCLLCNACCNCMSCMSGC